MPFAKCKYNLQSDKKCLFFFFLTLSVQILVLCFVFDFLHCTSMSCQFSCCYIKHVNASVCSVVYVQDSDSDRSRFPFIISLKSNVLLWNKICITHMFVCMSVCLQRHLHDRPILLVFFFISLLVLYENHIFIVNRL